MAAATLEEAKAKFRKLNELRRQVEALSARRSGAESYEAHSAKAADAWRTKAKSGQNFAPIPDVTPEELAEREACRSDFARFCKTYFPKAFRLPWSKDHLTVIAKIEAAILHGMLAAFAMPRSYGKTTLCKAAALWAILYGHRRWVVMIAATGPLATKLLKDGLKPMLRSNRKLADAFPAVCKPFRIIDNSSLKARGLHHNNEPAYIVWEKETLVFPRVAHDSCMCPESRVTCFGIEGALRGQVATLSTGEELRPDFVLVDDPQTKATARSVSETQNRYEIVMGDILGLAGGDVSIAGLVPCTVIQKGDLAERLLDDKETPEMRGERTKLVYKFPTDEKLWEEYFALRENNKGNGKLSTEFYRSNQEAMDAGAEVAWPERHPPEFASAIEHAMYLRYRNPGVFYAEFQNEPVEQDEAEGTFLSAQQIQGKINGYDRGAFPTACTAITAFIDVQQDSLWWMVCAWEPSFTGYVIDYGCWPQQNRSHYSKRNLRHTLAMRYKGVGAEAAIYAGLGDLTQQLFGRKFTRDDGAAMPLDLLLVDSGDFTETIYSFTRQARHAGSILPSKGIGVTASNASWSEIKPKPGEVVGHNWIKAPVAANRSIKLVRFDANSWKTFVQLRLSTALGDKGCLSLFKATHYDHRMIAEHLTAEAPFKTEGRGRTLWEWKLPANRPDNELLDCLTGCAVGASMQKIALAENKSKGGERKRMSLAEMAAAAGGGG